MGQCQYFLHARFDDLAEDLARDFPRTSASHTGHRDDVVSGQIARRRDTEFFLDPFGLIKGCSKAHRNVVGKVVPPQAQDRGLLDGSVGEDRDIRRTAPDIHHANPKIALVVRQNSFRRSQGLQHDVDYVESGLVAALDDILGAGDGGRDNVDLGLEAHAAHTQGFSNAILIVDDELLRDHVDHLTVHGNGYRLGGVDDAFYVDLLDLAVLYRHYPVTVEGSDMPACDSRVDRGNFAVGHQFRLFHRVLDGRHRGIDIDYHALSKPTGRVGADSHHVDSALGLFSDNSAYFCGADIESDDQFIVARHFVSPQGLARRVLGKPGLDGRCIHIAPPLLLRL